MQVKETDLFKQFSLWLMERNKEHLDEVKEKVSMYANVKVDNSGVIRGMIEFLYDHPELLRDVAPYVAKYKGFNVHEEFINLVKQNKSIKEIQDAMGIGEKRIQKINDEYGLKIKKR
ncbi:hypothetical protein NDS46_31150 (plasmid) [Paenibacillus thiaminolyticus]|uniref:hypothetical protein n=1 Tax=Paenibacillus thiaminolyticus TaxID=49283 RepID=UPI00232D303A|nr:hypothetical protein [Paenibacillus thiaminolyticus]WCF11416.1 hypothetical protein NDS46_31150 [Paenibacillus thiaminolyticus]